MNKVVFRFYGHKFEYFFEVFLLFFQPAVCFEKSPSQLRNSSWGALLLRLLLHFNLYSKYHRLLKSAVLKKKVLKCMERDIFGQI